MDIRIFTKMLKDKHYTDYKKLKYKYNEHFEDFLSALNDLYYKQLPIKDFDGNQLVYTDEHISLKQNTVKLMLQGQSQCYGIKAAEDEIISTSAIESIDFSRDSVRNILRGMSPRDEQEYRIAGIKKGLEFISDTQNKITEENLHKLYMMTVGDFMPPEDSLAAGSRYRNDTVFIVSDRIEHSGMDYKKIPECMKALVDFANSDDDINDLIKACIIHFYIAYVHPYFDGNGRIARLVHLWFLILKGYQSALFIPFSSRIEKSRKVYYNAYTLIEENKKLSGKIDITPFIIYFTENVYNNTNEISASAEIMSAYKNALNEGKITKKETLLWKFVLSYYGMEEFSTKQLEKDFCNAAYATIRGFVLKFEELGLMTSVKYGIRTKYRISDNL